MVRGDDGEDQKIGDVLISSREDARARNHPGVEASQMKTGQMPALLAPQSLLPCCLGSLGTICFFTFSRLWKWVSDEFLSQARLTTDDVPQPWCFS